MSVKILDETTQVADFRQDFLLDTKAMDGELVPDENGDLWIEGYASDFGLDRQDEAFETGSFDKGLKAYMDTNPVMLYHHKFSQALGHFTEARLDNNGLFVRGRVDKPEPGTEAADIFNKIRRRTIRGFSVGGLFKRKKTPAGWRITDVDLAEISVTPFPVNSRTTFAAMAGKAFEDVILPTGDEITEADIRDEDKEALTYLTEGLDRIFKSLEKRTLAGRSST